MNVRELYEEAFHVATEIREAASAEARARIILRLPDQLVVQMAGALGRACYDTDFALGQAYLDVRVASMLAVRLPDGELPDLVRAHLATYRGLVLSLTGLGK